MLANAQGERSFMFEELNDAVSPVAKFGSVWPKVNEI